jgi:hypothetical protein
MPWRPEDEALLLRLEDEIVLARLFSLFTGAFADFVSQDGGQDRHAIDEEVGKGSTSESKVRVALALRAAGLVGEIRKLPGGEAVVAAAVRGEVEALGRFVDATALDARAGTPPPLLHHLAVFHARAAAVLAPRRPQEAATAWVRALAAWLALAGERSYLEALETSILGAPPRGLRDARDVRIEPGEVPIEWLVGIGAHAKDAARDLSPVGQAALALLARTEEAAKLAGADAALARRVRTFAERQRNAAIEAALAALGDALDEANVRGELATAGTDLLKRAVPVWTWSARDPMVEQFVVDRAERIGWELYRARRWSDLAALLLPFGALFESLAARIMSDPSQIAYASGCAQMFVFLAEVERTLPRKLEVAERAIKICPSHRNGRLVLASALCEEAMARMRPMNARTPAAEIDRVAALVVRAESLYPQSSVLPEARRALEQLRPPQAPSAPSRGAGP